MVKIKRLVILLIICSIAFCACSKNDKNKMDTMDLKKVQLVGKYKSDIAPGMTSNDGFEWFFYPDGRVIVMKKGEFNGKKTPSTSNVKYGKYKFYEEKTFKITFVDKSDTPNYIFVLSDENNIKIQSLDYKKEKKLVKQKDKVFENELAKANLLKGKYELFIEGKKKFHGLYINVKNSWKASVFDDYKDKLNGSYYIFDDLVLIGGDNTFIYNKYVKGFKMLKVPGTNNILKHE